jgi:shikimate kinase
MEPVKRIHLHLIGFMGTGKSEVGRALADRLNLPFLDADRAIERRAGKTVAEIFRTKGEATFRAMEKGLAEGLGSKVSRVIAWGGGAWLKEENRKRMLESGTVILLTCSEAALWKRLEPEVAIRPLLMGPNPRENFRKLLKARKAAYKGADMTVSTTGKSPEEIAREILKRLRG